MMLLTQCYYHRGTRLNAMKRLRLCSLWSHLNVSTFFLPDWGVLRRSRCGQIFLLTMLSMIGKTSPDNRTILTAACRRWAFAAGPGGGLRSDRAENPKSRKISSCKATKSKRPSGQPLHDRKGKKRYTIEGKNNDVSNSPTSQSTHTTPPPSFRNKTMYRYSDINSTLSEQASIIGQTLNQAAARFPP